MTITITFGIMGEMREKIEILSITFFIITMGIFVFSGLPYGFLTKPFLYAAIGFAAGYIIGKMKDKKG